MNQHRTSGFTLVEILVSVVVLSVGLLGVAGLQLKGLRGTHTSNLRIQAIIMANNMAEKIRANPMAAQNPVAEMDNSYASIDSSQINCETPPSPYCSNFQSSTGAGSEDCTFREMASFDTFVWYCGIETETYQYGGVKNSIPGSSSSISCMDRDLTDADTCTSGSAHRIVVSWTELSPAGDDETKSVAMIVTP